MTPTPGHGHSKARWRRWAVVVIALAAIWTGACAGSAAPAAGAPGASATPQGLPLFGGASPGPPKLDSAHTIRLANLATAAGGGPGQALDVYPLYVPDAGTKPVISGLAYGRVSEPWHPGSPGGSPAPFSGFAIYVAGAKPGTDKPMLNMSVDSDAPAREVLYLFGAPQPGSPHVQRLSEVEGKSSAEVTLPPVPAGKVLLSVDSTAIGDADTAYPNEMITFGPPGRCLKAFEDQNPNIASTWHANARWNLAIDPGTNGLAFWHTGIYEGYHDSDLKCQGTPIATVDVSALGAGGRAWVFLYGPTATDLHAVVAPFLT